MSAYRVLRGLNYIPAGQVVEKRVEAGEIATDLLAVSIPWLLEDGLIEPVSDEGAQEAQDQAPAAVAAPDATTEPEAGS